MRVAICLLTCERYDYTKRTVESLALHNELRAFTLLHGDDASRDNRNREIAEFHGFELVKSPVSRQGVMAMQSRLAAAAADRRCDWTVILQNDWECVRSFPYGLLMTLDRMPDVHCLRLYGRWKERGARPTGDAHKGKGGKPAGWRPLECAPEAAEIGDIHWGSPPCATRTPVLRWLLAGAERERDVRAKSGEISTLTARVVDNVFWHIGADRTPEFKR